MLYTHENLTRGGAYHYLSCLLASPGKDISEASVSVQLRGGMKFAILYDDWARCAKSWDCDELAALGATGVPFPDISGATLCVGDDKIVDCLVWKKQQVAITDGEEDDDIVRKAASAGWMCIPADDLDAREFAKQIGG